MKKPACIFVQNNYVSKLTIPVAKFAHENNIILIDRSSTPDFDIQDCGVDWQSYSKVLFFGSVQFIRRLSTTSFCDQIFYTDEKFDSKTWTDNLSSKMLNEEFLEMTAKECFNHIKRTNQAWHIRPKFESKSFNGDVYGFEKWTSIFESRALHEDLLCTVSPLKDVQQEWRVWIVDNKIVQISQYKKGSQLYLENCTDAEIWQQASRLSSEWLPFSTVVMDMAQLQTKEFKIIEFNPIHSSGWYAAFVGKVVEAMLTPSFLK